MEEFILNHNYFMKEALKEARQAFEENEVPVGAVVVLDGQIIARAHNQVERLTDATAHAEMLAITAAENALASKYLKDCNLYVTLEPCVMCAGAMSWAQLGKLIYGARDTNKGYSLIQPGLLSPSTEVIQNILAKESTDLLQAFFAKRRSS